MNFDLTQEQVIFRDAIRRFMEEEMAPFVDEAEETETTPRALFTKMGALGYLCVRAPERYGGAAVNKISECVMREEMARVCQGFASAWSAHSHLGTFPILRMGTEEQIERYAVPAIRGRRIAAFALTEPNAGSDVKGIQTRAELTKGGYVLGGAKSFSTNATIADHIVVAAYTDRTLGYSGISLLIVDRGMAGMSITKMKKEGIRSSEAGEIVFDDCFVPRENLIGEKEGLFPLLMETLCEGRVGVAAFSVGIAQAALEAATRYAREREAFGKKIGKFQGVSHKIADMAADVEAARCLVYKAAWLVDEGRDYRRAASLAKLFASEMAVRVTRDAMQVFGGVGLTREFPVGRYHRDALVYVVGEGTSEIQRNIIAKDLGL